MSAKGNGTGDDLEPISDGDWYRSETLFDAHERIARDIERDKILSGEDRSEDYELGQRAALTVIEEMLMEARVDEQ